MFESKKKSNSYPSFRKELKLPEPKTSEQIDKLAMNEKLTHFKKELIGKKTVPVQHSTKYR